jgi:hypothetical protein
VLIGSARADWLHLALSVATTTSGPMMGLGAALIATARLRNVAPSVAAQ